MPERVVSGAELAGQEMATAVPALRQTGVALLACLVALTFTYYSVLADLVTAWTNPDYSHGFIVVPFAAYLAWRLRTRIADVEPRPSWLGLGILIGAFLMRRVGLFCWFASLERLSLVISVWGVVLLVAGWQVTRRMAGPLLFLLLMVPPPAQAVASVTLPLQLLATKASAWILSMMGWDVTRMGNLLKLPLQTLQVAEACNGLRMVFAIVTLGAAMACLAVRRSAWERIILVASTVPVALLVNVARVVATGAISEAFHGPVDPVAVHDYAGFLIVPVAILMLWWEQRFLRSLMRGSTSSANAQGEERR